MCHLLARQYSRIVDFQDYVTVYKLIEGARPRHSGCNNKVTSLGLIEKETRGCFFLNNIVVKRFMKISIVWFKQASRIREPRREKQQNS